MSSINKSVNPGEKQIAPTNQATHDALEKSLSSKLSEGQHEFVILVDMWIATKAFEFNTSFPPNDAFKQNGLSPVEFDAYCLDPKIQVALKERHIEVPRKYLTPDDSPKPPVPSVGEKVSADNDWKNLALTPIQLLTANTMLDLVDQRSDRKKLADLNVTSKQYQAWLSDPKFSGYMAQRAESLINHGAQHNAMLALLDRVNAGDIQAIKYYHELIGRFQPNTATNKELQEAYRVIADLQSLQVQIVEIISDEVDGPAAQRVAERMKSLITARRVSHELTNPDGSPTSVGITPPTIKQQQTLTPELEALKAQSNAGELSL